MSVVINQNKCKLCRACVEVCPEDAIISIRSINVVNTNMCVECETCVGVCPNDAIARSERCEGCGEEDGLQLCKFADKPCSGCVVCVCAISQWPLR